MATARVSCVFFFFFFNDTATTEIYTLSLHDALPISPPIWHFATMIYEHCKVHSWRDRKSTRLNSSHANISYAVFCLKKKKQHNIPSPMQKKTKKSPTTLTASRRR